MAQEVWRPVALGDEGASSIGGREPSAQEARVLLSLGQRHVIGGGAKKALRPAQRRVVVDTWRAQFAGSARRAWHVLQTIRSTYQYRSRRDPQAFLRKKIRQLAETRTRCGYPRIYVLLRREGWAINHKRVYRLYERKASM